MFKYLLFDLDGTITDPKEGITKCVQYALKAFGIDEPHLENLMSFIGPPLVDEFARKYGFDHKTCLKLLEKYRERFSTVGIYENALYDGCENILKELKESGKIICLATSKPEPFAKRILEHFNIAEYFDCVTGSEFDGTRNAKAEVIEEVFKRINLDESHKNEAVMIGDRKQDVIGAKLNHIKCIGIRMGYAEEGELENAGCDYYADDLYDLRDIILDRRTI